MTVRVLALDLSTNTGVAFDAVDATNTPAFATWELAKAAEEDYGTRFLDLEYRLESAIDRIGPNVLAFERPIVPMGRSFRLNVVRLLIGLASVAELVGKRNGLDVREVPVSTIKAHFGGKAGSGNKQPIMDTCARLGWKIKNADEADAAALWSYVKTTMDPKFSYQTTPLFSRSR